MSAEYSGVILSAEPWTDIMVCHSLDVLHPLFELLELPVLVEELCCNIILHAVGTEGRPDGVIGAQLVDELVRHVV